MSDLRAIWAFDTLDDEAVPMAEGQHKPCERSPRPRHGDSAPLDSPAGEVCQPRRLAGQEPARPGPSLSVVRAAACTQIEPRMRLQQQQTTHETDDEEWTSY